MPLACRPQDVGAGAIRTKNCAASLVQSDYSGGLRSLFHEMTLLLRNRFAILDLFSTLPDGIVQRRQPGPERAGQVQARRIHTEHRPEVIRIRGWDVMAKYKALFINFYGTLVWEDENILQIVFRNIQVNSRRECSLQEIGTYWWQSLSRLLIESYGSDYQSQRQLAWECLAETLIYFDSFSRPEDLLALQYANWEQPNIYEDARRFVEQARQYYPVYILSNTDRADIESALRLHDLQVDGVITSEDVRAYKPRPEMFRCALEQFGVKREDVLHIGDSLSGDVGGATNVGIDTVWLNRKNKLSSFPHTRFICSDLLQLSSYLL